MGPGIAVKAAMQRHFSLMVFGWSQIAMDLQPLFAMLSGRGELHGFSHTLMGATLIGLACAITGKPLGELGLRLLREAHHLPIRWQVSCTSAFIGSYSHIAIDSIMHVDVQPLFPLSTASPLHALVSIDTLHLLCAAGALAGGAVWYGISSWRQPGAR